MAGKDYSINFRIKTDAKPTRKELEMTVKEFRDFNKTVKASQTPLDRFEKDLSDLNKAFKAGGVNAKQYEHRLKTIQSRYKGVEKEQKKVNAGLLRSTDAMTKFVATTAGIAMVQKGFASLSEEMHKLDQVGKTALGIGASTDFLTGLEHVAQTVSGLNAGAATKGIEKMVRRLAEAAQGTGEAKVALEMLGIEAKALEGLRPERQFQILSRAMDGVTDAGQRTLIATKLFDDEQSKLHTTMMLSNQAYKEQINLAEKLGVVVVQAEADKAAAFVDSEKRMTDSYNRMKKQTALATADYRISMMDTITGAFQASQGEGTRKDWAKTIKGLGQYGPLGRLVNEPIGRLIEPMGKLDAEANRLAGQQEKRQAAEVANQKKYNQELNKTLKWEELLTKEQQKQEKTDRLTDYLGRKMGQGEDVLKTLGLGASHLALSAAGQFDRAMNVNRSKKDDQFEAIVTDPLDSIAASSSEAFKIQNKNTSFQKVTEESEKETAKNTKGLWDTQTSMLSLLENATGIGL